MKHLSILFITLISLNLQAKEECGISGTVSERIDDCNEMHPKGFALVSRINTQKDTFEVYKDLRTNLVWSDKLDSLDMTYDNAKKACESIYSKIASKGYMNDIWWRLPTLHDFLVATQNGLAEVVPNTDHIFWTSTIENESYQSKYKYYLSNKEPREDLYPSKVRCVSQAY